MVLNALCKPYNVVVIFVYFLQAKWFKKVNCKGCIFLLFVNCGQASLLNYHCVLLLITEHLRKTRVLHLLDVGSYTNGRALKMLSGHTLTSIKTIRMQIVRPVQLVVSAAEGKTGFGTFILWCLAESVSYHTWLQWFRLPSVLEISIGFLVFTS